MTQVKISELTKELEGMSEKEEVSKSMDLSTEQDVTPVAEAKIPEPEKEKEEEAKEDEEKVEEGKEEEEVVEKSAEKKEDKDEDKEDEKDSKKKEKGKGKDKDKDKDKDEKKEDKEEVKKSEAPTAPAEASELISGAELLSAFEAVVKSYDGVKTELKETRASIVEEVKKSILPMIENIAKHFEELKKKEVKEEVAEEPKEEEVKEPEVKEEEEVVEKSMTKVDEEEELEGKAVEYIEKSANTSVEEEAEEVVEEVFKAIDHASEVVDIAIARKFDAGTNHRVFHAVNRVKEGRETEDDIDIFKKVLSM